MHTCKCTRASKSVNDDIASLQPKFYGGYLYSLTNLAFSSCYREAAEVLLLSETFYGVSDESRDSGSGRTPEIQYVLGYFSYGQRAFSRILIQFVDLF